MSKRILSAVPIGLLLSLTATGVFAQDAPALDTVAATAADTATSLNVLWVLLAGFLVFFMQAGFALVETGFTRAKNVAHTMMMNMMVFCIGALGYWLVGFALQFGAVNHTYGDINNMGAWAFSPVTLGDWTGVLDSGVILGEQWGVMGLSGFMLAGLTANFGVLAFFLFQMVFMDTAATIPTGSMGARELQGLHRDGAVCQHVHLPAGWHVGVGWRLAGELGTHTGLGQRRRGLCWLWRGAHGRRHNCPDRRDCDWPAHRQIQQERHRQRHPRSQHPDGYSRYDHPLLRLVWLQSGVSAGLYWRFP